MSQTTNYIPGLGIAQLTPLYDASLATIFQERRFRMPLVRVLAVQPGERVLDVGCGTGTLDILIAAHTAAGLVAGIDIDPAMLALAQRKIAEAGAAVTLAAASAAVLPFAAGSFDCIAASLMLHHLPTPLKQAMLAEVQRVLVPGGRLCVLDFGPVDHGALAAVATKLLGGFEEAGDNLAGRVPLLLAEAGLVEVAVSSVAFGGVVKLYTGRKPQ